MGQWRAVIVVLLCLGGWPAAAHAQGSLVMDPDGFDFGELLVGTSSSATLEVWNNGSEPLTLGDIRFVEGGGPFGLGFPQDCVSDLVLEPGWGCDLRVWFSAPAERGNHEAVVVVEADGDAEIAQAALTGSSYALGNLVAEPASLDFGALPFGSASPPQGVTFRNVGDRSVIVSGAGVSARGSSRDFKVMGGDSCLGTVAPGATCGFSAVFEPYRPLPPRPVPPVSTAAFRLSLARFEVRVQDRRTPLTVPLRGLLSIPPLPPRPPKVDYGVIEQDLKRPARSIPGLIRGGPRRTLRLPSFKAPTSGWLNLLVRESGGPKRRGRLASGTLEVKGGEQGRLRFSLSRKARNLLRQPAKTRVKVVVAFKADTGRTFRRAVVLTVRRPAKTGNQRRV